MAIFQVWFSLPPSTIRYEYFLKKSVTIATNIEQPHDHDYSKVTQIAYSNLPSESFLPAYYKKTKKDFKLQLFSSNFSED